VTGLGAVLLTWGVEGVSSLLLHGAAGFTPPGHGFPFATVWHPPSRSWALLLVLPAAGLLVGWLVQRFAPEAEGHGTDAVIDAFHRKRSIMRGRVIPIKLIASMFTIGSGGSAGREGPVAQVGAGFASALSRALRLSTRDRRTLLVAGMAGGIGGMFRAPLGGALFAIDVLYSDNEFESEALIPAVIASIVSYVVNNSLTGWSIVFNTPSLRFTRPAELLAYLVLAVLLALVGIVYLSVFYAVRDGFFKPLPVPDWVKPGIGALGVAMIAFFLPQVLGGGYGWLQLTLDGKLAIGLLMLLVPAKILATSLTIGSGGSGGVFAPSLIIGGMTGAVFAVVAETVAPGLAPEPAACVLVGMGGFFAGVAKVPIAALVLVAEMSGSYRLLVPMMLVASVTYLLTRGMSIYEAQVRGRIDSPAHLGEFEVDVLRRMTVASVMQPDSHATVHPETRFTELVELTEGSPQAYFPIVDDDQRLIGVVSLTDIRALAGSPEVWPVLVAADLGVEAEAVAYLTPDEDLHAAARKFSALDLGALPVLDGPPPARLHAMLTYRQVLEAYDGAVRTVGETSPFGEP